jgi:hypothetical protein
LQALTDLRQAKAITAIEANAAVNHVEHNVLPVTACANGNAAAFNFWLEPVFDGVFKNSFFLVIVVGTFVVQYLLIEIQGLNTAFGCTNLTKDQWIACMLLVLFLCARFQMIISAQVSDYILLLNAVH